MTIHIDTWVGVALCIGFLVPALLSSIVCGMGAWFMLERAIRRCRGGTYLRKAAYRAWPNKFTGEKCVIDDTHTK